MADFTYKIMTLSDGQQVMASEVPGVVITAMPHGVTVVEEQAIDVTAEQFEEIAEKAKTEYIESDTIRGKEMSITTPQDMTEDTEVTNV